MVEFRPEPAGSPTARALLAAMEQEMFELYEMSEMPMPAGTADLAPPAGGAFLVGWEADQPVAGGGLVRMGPGVAEIKRMYVVPEARRRGHARRLLTALEDAARALGYERVRLDTGARQPHARALYTSAGFKPIPDYNDNPKAAYWGEKVL
jgi:GNAT superfamily N-acetyltransferase